MAKSSSIPVEIALRVLWAMRGAYITSCFTPTMQQYDWGKLGKEIKVAQFAAASVPEFTVDNAKPYAEVSH